MFPDRIQYLETIVAGKYLAPEEAPKPLLKLMLETACQSYREYLSAYSDCIPTLFITADTNISLRTQIRELSEFSEIDASILEAFSSIKEDESKEVIIGDTKVQLKRQEDIDLDDL